MKRYQSANRQERLLIGVALAATTETDLALLEGIREVAASRRSWDLLVLTGGYEGTLRQLADLGELHGAIGDFVSDAWVQELTSRKVSVVQTAQLSFLQNAVNVSADFGGMGRAAAQALRRNTPRTFAFLGAPGQFAAAELQEAYCAELANFGIAARMTNVTSPPLLREFLRTLDLPAAIFAASDRLARLAAGAAGTLGWTVPRDMAVIGMGNHRLESVHAGMPLSSFELPAREIGRRAAQILANLLAGHPVPLGLAPDRPAGHLHERASSLSAGSGLERALAHAKSHLDRPLQTGDLARIAGMSRRSFENAIQREHGISPGIFLQRLRRERAEALLRKTDLAIREIGQACGYGEPAVFSTAFKRWTGLTPRAFRLKRG